MFSATSCALALVPAHHLDIQHASNVTLLEFCRGKHSDKVGSCSVGACRWLHFASELGAAN